MTEFTELESGASVSTRVVSVRSFAEFCAASGYVSVYEEQADGVTWRDNDILIRPLSLKDALALSDAYNPDAAYLVLRDALAYCAWHGGVRLPSFSELVETGLNVHGSHSGAAAFEIFDGGEDRELGLAAIVPPPSSVETLNRLHGSHLSYEEVVRASILELTLDSPMASFRFVKCPLGAA